MSWSGVLDVALFLLSAGFEAAVWTVVGAVAGLVIGLVLTVAAHRLLDRLLGNDRDSGRMVAAFAFLTLAFWWISVPLLTSGGGAIVGAGLGAQRVVMRDEVLRPATALAFAAARGALRTAPSPEGLAEEHALALELVEGETTYGVDEIDGLFDRFSEDALVRARGAIGKLSFGSDETGESGVARATDEPAVENPPPGAGRIAALLAKQGTERFIDFLIEHQRNATRDRWLAPVIEDLRATDPEGDDQVTGPQIGHSIARAHLQRPLGRAALLGIASGGHAIIVAVVLLLRGLAPATRCAGDSRESIGRRSGPNCQWTPRLQLRPS